MDFKIHNLTEEQFQELKDAGQIDPNAIYCTPDETEIKLAGKVDIMQGAENAGKILEVDNEGKVKPASKPSSLPLLFHTWSDCIMNNQSWLRADTFSWHSGDTYKAAYESIKNGYDSLSNEVLYAYDDEYDNVLYLKTSTPSIGDQLFDENGEPANKDYGGWFVRKIYSDGSISYDPNTPDTRYYRNASKDIVLSVPASTTETIGDIKITYYRAKNGRKICLPDQESNLLTLYNSTGVAWYYILDTENKRFKLPRTKYGFTGLRDSVGGYVEAGLPNITGNIGHLRLQGNINPIANGAFTLIGATTSAASLDTSATQSGNAFSFDASRSSSVYGNSDTVQPKATQMYLYFYVGNFEQSAVEQTAGLNAELFNGKADRDLKNLPSNYDYVVATQEPTSANGYTWFRKYKSGWVEQGGRAVIYDGEAGPNQYNAKDISIPVPMKHCTNWHCQAKHDRFNTGIGQDNITTTAHIYQANDSTSSFTNAFVIWEINGYAA